TRSLLGVFEEDAAAISSYINQLYQAMRRIYDAQLSSCHAVLSTQLADAMMFPITQFKERDLKEILTLKEVFQIASNGPNLLVVDAVNQKNKHQFPRSILSDKDNHDTAINRYSRLSKRRENEKVKYEVTEDVYTSKKKQHQTMMHYFCALNTLQYKKKIAMLEPLLGYMQAQISFFKMGSENLTEQLEEFLTNIGTSVQNVRREMDSEVETMQQTIEDLEVASDPLYLPDPDTTKFPVHRNLTRKAGYLNARNKTGLVSSSWDRQFYFTQGGNLMSQARGDVAGGLVMDIDNCSVMAVDCEDRRYCFQITSFDGKKSSILQADSKKDYEEWICTINNISKQIYLSENPEILRSPLKCSSLCLKPTSNSILHQLFIVRFLGSMEVKSDESPDVVYETMRQILAARAIHNIFRMTESHLLVSCDCLKLIDPQTQVTRLRICDSVGLAKQIAFHAELDRRASEKQKEIDKVKEKQQKELSKQKQIEKDLEEQSRLIAASSRPSQSSGEGQFVLLSSSQSEDSDLGEDGKKKRESEA
ncbi:DCC-interacting protein 13-alpha, partial [Chelonia mydas]